MRETLLATDGIKPVGPVWPGRPVQQSERKEQRRDKPRRDEESPSPARGDDDDTAPTIDEYARQTAS